MKVPVAVLLRREKGEIHGTYNTEYINAHDWVCFQKKTFQQQCRGCVAVFRDCRESEESEPSQEALKVV